ncbi:MAG: hypothetical protein HOC09_07085 [Deltaproteobacteria bacterium]|jgi:hypothetical protein|nr:hypothetical protein [Deltaproteobacteria bacterium]
MKSGYKELLSKYSTLDFGDINLQDEEQIFGGRLDHEMLNLCQLLPKSLQSNALLHIMQHFGGRLQPEIDIIRHYYYIPAWSIIYWLTLPNPGVLKLNDEEINQAITAHTMALFLHAFDDHLTDGEIPVSHLALQLRSQSWILMMDALYGLAIGIQGGPRIVDSLIDDYYSGIESNKKAVTLDEFGALFMKQMTTWMIVPILLTKRATKNDGFVDAIQSIFGSFGFAWRLLDDIKDIESDFNSSSESAIYISLSDEMKKLWKPTSPGNLAEKNIRFETVMDYIVENRTIEKIVQRIIIELESAASRAEYINMTGFARELACLAQPLLKSMIQRHEILI